MASLGEAEPEFKPRAQSPSPTAEPSFREPRRGGTGGCESRRKELAGTRLVTLQGKAAA